MRLTIITATLALAALTACNPLNPPQLDQVIPASINIAEADVGGCEPPTWFDVSLNRCESPTPPTSEVPPVYPTDGCDVELGGTYDVTLDRCIWPNN